MVVKKGESVFIPAGYGDYVVSGEAEIFRGIVDITQTYKAKLMNIPTPRFVVFYNGTIPMEDEKVYRLSDMYEKKRIVRSWSW
jgi:hypothetical protein